LVPARLQIAAKWLAPFWVVAVVVGSFVPGSIKLLLGTKPYQHNHPVELQHRLAHFGTFGVTTLLFLLTAERPRNEKTLAGVAFLMGCIIEAAQFATGLSVVLEWWDVRDDFLAAVAVLVAFKTVRLMRRMVRHQSFCSRV
jgi:hypothetical protein